LGIPTTSEEDLTATSIQKSTEAFAPARDNWPLQALAGSLARPFGELRTEVAPEPPDRTLRDDLAHLKRLGLINSRGMGRGAVWFLKRPNEAE
jgi:hypothetical protein